MKEPVVSRIPIIFKVCLFIFFSMGLHSDGHTETFLSHINDVPLPYTFNENQDDILVFDTPEGRVITQKATGQKQIQDIEIYYKSTLPALGWSLTHIEKSPKILTFQRENEMLTLKIENDGREANIYFNLIPAH